MELDISPRTTFPLARMSGDIEGSAWTLIFSLSITEDHTGAFLLGHCSARVDRRKQDTL
jgi:hypothetical protein